MEHSNSVTQAIKLFDFRQGKDGLIAYAGRNTESQIRYKFLF